MGGKEHSKMVKGIQHNSMVKCTQRHSSPGAYPPGYNDSPVEWQSKHTEGNEPLVVHHDLVADAVPGRLPLRGGLPTGRRWALSGKQVPKLPQPKKQKWMPSFRVGGHYYFFTRLFVLCYVKISSSVKTVFRGK